MTRIQNYNVTIQYYATGTDQDYIFQIIGQLD